MDSHGMPVLSGWVETTINKHTRNIAILDITTCPRTNYDLYTRIFYNVRANYEAFLSINKLIFFLCAIKYVDSHMGGIVADLNPLLNLRSGIHSIITQSPSGYLLSQT